MANPDTRFELLELDIPAPKAPAPEQRHIPGEMHRAAIMECRTIEDLERVAGTFTSDTLMGRMFRSLPRATSDSVRHLWRAMRLAIVWVRLWRSMCEAISQPVTLVTAPEIEAPTVPADFAGIAGESAANASASNLGDLANGRATLGVGFSSAEGYLEALRRGVKRATCDEYTRILRTTYNVTVDFPVRILDENTLPVGEGITHTPTGPSVFDASHPDRAANRARFGAKSATAIRPATHTPERRYLSSANLIAGAIASGQGALVSWPRGRGGYRAARNGATSRGELLTALGSINAAHLAPAAPSAAKQFGEAMRTLNANGLVTRHATRKIGEAIPADVESRFIVGHVDASADLGSLGDKRLIADLTITGMLRFTGSDSLAARVRADYESRVASDTYTSTDLSQWLERTLRNHYHAVTCGAHLYVPAAHVVTVRALVGAVRSIMGRAFQVIPVTSGEDLIAGLAEGLADEVAEIRTRFERETLRVRAESRANIGSRMATTMLIECHNVRERVTGYAAMLGDSAVATVKADLATLETALRALTDDTSQRFAALDLT